MFHKPEDPRQFLVEQLQILQEKQKTVKLGSTIFTESDIKTLFGMFDPTGKGSITGEQCKQGMIVVFGNLTGSTLLSPAGIYFVLVLVYENLLFN